MVSAEARGRSRRRREILGRARDWQGRTPEMTGVPHDGVKSPHSLSQAAAPNLCNTKSRIIAKVT